MQPVAICGQQVRQPLFVNRDDVRAQPPDPFLVDVANEDVVAQLGEAGGGDETDPSCAHDADRIPRASDARTSLRFAPHPLLLEADGHVWLPLLTERSFHERHRARNPSDAQSLAWTIG